MWMRIPYDQEEGVKSISNIGGCDQGHDVHTDHISQSNSPGDRDHFPHLK